MTGQKELYDIFELIYPVGIIIELATNANPKDLFGIGEWEQIKDRFILAAGDSTTAGNTGGSETVTLSTANIPAHAHTRGTMNIIGGISSIGHTPGVTWGLNTEGTYTDGCFFIGDSTGETQAFQDYKKTTRRNSILFNAANNWTGETSYVGSGEAFSNMPPYYVAYLWRRVS